MKRYPAQTELCNCENSEIKGVAEEIRAKSSDDGEFVVNAFYYVRDEIKFFFEPLRKASETLRIKRGGCDNKSNLLVAILRANKIPARFAFQWISGKSFEDIPIINTNNKFMRRVKHSVCEVYINNSNRWLRMDCTRDKYFTPERAFEFDGKKSTDEHPYLIKECGHADDLLGLKKEEEKRLHKFGDLSQIFNILVNLNIDDQRFKNSNIRTFSDEDIKTICKKCYELGESLKLKHRGNAKMVLASTKFFANIYNLNTEVLEKKDKYVKYLSSFPVNIPQSVRDALSNFHSGFIHAINPELVLNITATEQTGKRAIEMVDNSNNSSYILPRIELIAKFL